MEGVSLRSYARSRRERGLPLHTHVGLGKAIREGRLGPPAVTSEGRINPAEADAALAEVHPEARPVEAETESGTPSHTEPHLGEIRRQREALRLRREHLDVVMREGKLMEAESVREAVRGAARQMRDRLLAIPPKLAPQCAGLNEHEAFSALEREVLDALEAFEHLDLRS